MVKGHKQTILEMMGPIGYRQWRIYLAGARWAFEAGLNSVFQALLYKSVDGRAAANDLPLNRDDWYRA